MSEISAEIREKLNLLPDKPGVYLMKNDKDQVIYVGKAVNLKNRVRSYFIGIPADAKTRRLVSHIHIFDYIIISNETEALLLEANLIKKYMPRYNVLLKDDKKYPFIKVTWYEPFPRIIVTREMKKDGGKYFGPYTDSKTLKYTLRSLEWVFPIRTCERIIPEDKIAFSRACMNDQLGKCSAPCIGKINRDEYRKLVNQLMRFLVGKDTDVMTELTQEMYQLSEEMKFELAAKVRDRIKQVEKLQKIQTVYFTDDSNRDVIGIYKEENHAAVTVLKILSGKLLQREVYPLENVEDIEIGEMLKAFILQYYTDRLDNLPKQIIMQEEPDELNELNIWLNNKIIVPQRGDNRKLIMIAKENAFNHIEEKKLSHLRKSTRTIVPVQELKEKLNLKKLPRKMICVDISTIMGTDTVSSLVFFENGKPKKSQYRRFIIKTVEGQDDFASMQETLLRFSAHFAEDEKWEQPDLIIIDGGKGQLSSAHQIIVEQKLTEVEMISLAKRAEEVFVPHNKESIILPRNSSALRLLTNIRDEAHRFAITFHRKRREMRTLTSDLDAIKGIGKDKKFMLLKRFGSVENLKKATVEELAEVKGIGEILAKQLLEELN